MEILNVNSQEFKNILTACFSGGGIIPVIGAGFSKGSEAFNGKVPDGNALIQMMLYTLKKAGVLEPEKIEKIKSMGFKAISRYYLNEKYVPRSYFVEDIRNNFTQVNISGVRRTFLKQNWKYIYTLNIDDGIERANRNITKVLPYKELDKKAQDINLLYKIHGCANEETLYKEESSLIFSEKQYIRSLTKNDHILTALKNDILESNLLYLGCSLDRELDIMYAVSGVTEDNLINSKRIYVTKDDIDEVEIDTLAEYGINVICRLNDYDDIYHLVNECLALADNNSGASLQKYQSESMQLIPSDKNMNIKFMLQGEGDENGSQKYFSIPSYIIERSREKDISKGIAENTVIVIKGRRFSGKTLLLKNLSIKIKNKKSYYFPSVTSLNIDDIKRMCSLKNSIYFIDSNVITYQEAAVIRTAIPDLLKNNTSFVIACNSTEVDIANTFSTFDIENNFFELPNFLNNVEMIALNRNLSSLGIVEWREKTNILESTFKTANIYPQIKQKIYLKKECTPTDFKCLVLLAILDKVYISLSRLINIGNKEAQDFAIKYTPIIELMPTNELEVNHKSRFKIVSNSRSWLLEEINQQFITLGYDSTKEILLEVIKTLLNNKQHEDTGKKMIMFDTINLLFSRKKGAGRLIIKLYEDLQPILSHEPDYWLQRAKAMGKVLKGERNLREAIDFAKKAYEDGKRDKTILNAEFTLANLHGKICENTNFTDKGLISDALYWYNSAIRNNDYNPKYINSMLENTHGKRGYLYTLCRNIIRLNLKLSSEEKMMFNRIMQFIAVR
ncbi:MULTISPECIES: SIR2 family protein [Klebsiella/Raoultella group]|uniref:SIR2 family protein n=1 Tax=Klebsiella/Raoultella group TaxID=2890311 RepID=UPI0011594CDF|nr:MULTISPECIES: SIR2 family protein [Klebsiella/Raoultella group]QPF28273.1 SIR2 family protein [Klebsiella sp. BDA134-6]